MDQKKEIETTEGFEGAFRGKFGKRNRPNELGARLATHSESMILVPWTQEQI